MVADGKQASTSEDKKQSEERPEQDKSDKKNKTNDGRDDKSNRNSATSSQIDQQRATSDTTSSNVQQQRPRRPRPLRPGAGAPVLRRQPGLVQVDPALVGMPIEAQIELASGVLQPAGRATAMPPRRPNYLPPVHHAGGGRGFQPSTSLGATALTGANSSKPNRYSWAQMQQWHAAQSAAAAAAEAAAAAAAAQDHTGVGGVAGRGERQSGFHYHFPTAFSRGAASRVLYVPNPIVNLSEHTKSRLVKIIEALKRFSEKWFSHVLLLLFLASYACLGAYIFISFEAPTEQWEKQLIIDTRLRIVNESYEMARESESRDAYTDRFRDKFEEYERLLNRVCASGMTSSSLENQWTFWGALFYSMTVFTTIGYGHLTPITFAGRVATMIYAIFGIPILLMVLADLGKLLTRIIKYAFKKFRYWYNKLLGRKASVRTRKLIQDNTNQYIGVARHAFERGFATYIQPYQSRLPTRFRESARAGQHDLIEQLQQQQLHSNLEQMQSSDVLITPANQTRPVSPKISSGEDSTSSPLANVANETSELNDGQQQQQQSHEHSPAQNTSTKGKHSQRSQSPGGTSKTRKISAHQQQRQEQQKKGHSSSKHSFVAHFHPSGGGGKTGDKSLTHAQKQASGDQVVGATQTSEPSPSPPPPPDRKRDVSPQGSVSLEMSDLKCQNQSAPGQLLDDTSNEQLDGFGGHPVEMNGDQFQDEEEEEEDDDEDDLDIPVSFALFLLITYMMFGAVVFSIWESWNFFDSLYFVFISMSTIGFGDLVPQHPKRMIGTFAYLLFGLALTSMCINVVQEKIHATFLRAKMQIGEKMGFDLDQIMADDYYGAEGGFDEAEELAAAVADETASCGANSSVALSQTNSAGGGLVDTTTAAAAGQMALASPSSQAKATVATSGELGETSGALSTAAPKSKSKESLKLKKRTSGGSGSQEHQSSSSVKRKTSSGNKKPATLAAAAANQRQQQQVAVAQQQQQQPVPLKPHIETIRVLNMPVMTQIDDTPTSPKRPSKNHPEIELTGVRAFCEPLRCAFQTSGAGGHSKAGQSGSSASLVAQRPRLQASRSQPNSPLAKSLEVTPPRPLGAGPYQMNGSQANTSRQHARHQQPAGPHIPRAYHYSTRSRASPAGGGSGAQQVAAAASLGRDRFYGPEGVSRSLGGSRRASVSHELSQLDDLIVALSHSSRPDRFGPLLGIPSTSTHSRRPSSSASSQPAAAAQAQTSAQAARANAPPLSTASSASSAAGFFHSNARRGTSLLVRPATAQPPAASDRYKKRSQAASSQDTPPFLTPSGSSNQLADQLRRKSSSSSVNSRMASARQSQRELNLSESQAALDELEAVKLSVRAAP